MPSFKVSELPIPPQPRLVFKCNYSDQHSNPSEWARNGLFWLIGVYICPCFIRCESTAHTDPDEIWIYSINPGTLTGCCDSQDCREGYVCDIRAEYDTPDGLARPFNHPGRIIRLDDRGNEWHVSVKGPECDMWLTGPETPPRAKEQSADNNNSPNGDALDLVAFELPRLSTKNSFSYYWRRPYSEEIFESFPRTVSSMKIEPRGYIPNIQQIKQEFRRAQVAPIITTKRSWSKGLTNVSNLSSPEPRLRNVSGDISPSSSHHPVEMYRRTPSESGKRAFAAQLSKSLGRARRVVQNSTSRYFDFDSESELDLGTGNGWNLENADPFVHHVPSFYQRSSVSSSSSSLPADESDQSEYNETDPEDIPFSPSAPRTPSPSGSYAEQSDCYSGSGYSSLAASDSASQDLSPSSRDQDSPVDTYVLSRMHRAALHLSPPEFQHNVYGSGTPSSISASDYHSSTGDSPWSLRSTRSRMPPRPMAPEPMSPSPYDTTLSSPPSPLFSSSMTTAMYQYQGQSLMRMSSFANTAETSPGDGQDREDLSDDCNWDSDDSGPSSPSSDHCIVINPTRYLRTPSPTINLAPFKSKNQVASAKLRSEFITAHSLGIDEHPNPAMPVEPRNTLYDTDPEYDSGVEDTDDDDDDDLHDRTLQVTDVIKSSSDGEIIKISGDIRVQRRAKRRVRNQDLVRDQAFLKYVIQGDWGANVRF